MQRTVFERADSGTASSFLHDKFGHMMRTVGCDIVSLPPLIAISGVEAAAFTAPWRSDGISMGQMKFSDEAGLCLHRGNNLP